MKQMMQRLLREPLFHFIAIGGLIFLLFAAVDDTGESPADVIVITPGRIDQLAAGFSSVWTRMPTDDELDALIDEEVREEVYYREALALGLDRNDAVVIDIPEGVPTTTQERAYTSPIWYTPAS